MVSKMGIYVYALQPGGGDATLLRTIGTCPFGLLETSLWDPRTRTLLLPDTLSPFVWRVDARLEPTATPRTSDTNLFYARAARGLVEQSQQQDAAFHFLNPADGAFDLVSLPSDRSQWRTSRLAGLPGPAQHGSFAFAAAQRLLFRTRAGDGGPFVLEVFHLPKELDLTKPGELQPCAAAVEVEQWYNNLEQEECAVAVDAAEGLVFLTLSRTCPHRSQVWVSRYRFFSGEAARGAQRQAPRASLALQHSFDLSGYCGRLTACAGMLLAVLASDPDTNPGGETAYDPNPANREETWVQVCGYDGAVLVPRLGSPLSPNAAYYDDESRRVIVVEDRNIMVFR
jgi:hypothetical protein